MAAPTFAPAGLAGIALVLDGAPGTKSTRFASVALHENTVLAGSAISGVERTDLLRHCQSTPLIVAGQADVIASVLDLPSAVPVWDLLELTALLHPRLRACSLEEVAESLGVARADDGSTLEAAALLVARAFAVLVDQLRGLDAMVLLQAAHLAASLDWPLRHLFREVERLRARDEAESQTPVTRTSTTADWVRALLGTPAEKPPQSRSARPRPLELIEALRHFGADGGLAAALPGYEPRSQQAEVVTAVVEALNSGDRLLVEAGTGTGKSLAYLVPCALVARKNRWRIVVSTATTTLQDQLFQKDLPVLSRALGEANAPRASVLKGRSNYLCLRRWELLLQASDLSQDDRTLLIKTLFWLPQTATGDRAELKLTPGEEAAWQRLAAVPEACTPHRCGYHRAGVCFLARARRAAQASEIVIANHALVLSDLAGGSRVLPEYQVLVVDEAHQLEDEATAQLGWKLSERELLGRLERLAASTGQRGGAGAVREALAVLRRSVPRAGELAGSVARVERSVPQIGRAIRGLFEALAGIVHQEAGSTDDGVATLRITGGTRAGSAWQEAETAWSRASGALLDVARILADLQTRLEDVPSPGDDLRELAAELQGHTDFWLQTRERLDCALHTPDRGFVYWLSGSKRSAPSINAAPLDVSAMLRSGLFEPPHAVILTSATLSVEGTFHYVKQRLGLEGASSLSVGSPFDYGSSALLYVPYDVPEPTHGGYQAALEQTLAETVLAARGRTLALFTSRAHLRTTHAALRQRLEPHGITVLGQGVDETSRTRLLEAFRNGRQVVLLGTSSFWEGIDVVGEALSCVVVARLPFAVPTDPVYAARAELFDDPFAEYAVPQAVLKLKQGFGRLIRSRTDRGAVVVLDRRIATRSYGGVFLRSLPPCQAKQGPAARTAQLVHDWLAA